MQGPEAGDCPAGHLNCRVSKGSVVRDEVRKIEGARSLRDL